jgi:dTMP kinase
MKRGIFIVFEGGEGAGKSLQVEILASHLREGGHAVTVTREPGGTRIGEQIRSITHNPENVDLDAKAEAYLMAASRAQHVAETIAPALEAGKIIISDRFLDSSLAYQGFGRQIGEEKVAQMNELAVGGATPDLTILLNISPEEGMSRRRASSKTNDRLDLQQKDFYERVYGGYLTLAKKDPARYLVIDASAPVETVGEMIWDFVKAFLEKRNGGKKS